MHSDSIEGMVVVNLIIIVTCENVIAMEKTSQFLLSQSNFQTLSAWHLVPYSLHDNRFCFQFSVLALKYHTCCKTPLKDEN